jgi:hypothetical protein
MPALGKAFAKWCIPYPLSVSERQNPGLFSNFFPLSNDGSLPAVVVRWLPTSSSYQRFRHSIPQRPSHFLTPSLNTNSSEESHTDLGDLIEAPLQIETQKKFPSHRFSSRKSDIENGVGLSRQATHQRDPRALVERLVDAMLEKPERAAADESFFCFVGWRYRDRCDVGCESQRIGCPGWKLDWWRADVDLRAFRRQHRHERHWLLE